MNDMRSHERLDTADRDPRGKSGVEDALKRRTLELGLRVKELNCLHYISRLIDTPDITLEGILRGVLKAIPPGFQYPEITWARIILHREETLREDARREEVHREETLREDARGEEVHREETLREDARGEEVHREETLREDARGEETPGTESPRERVPPGEYRTYNYRPTPWAIRAPVLCFGEEVGCIEAGYLAERPERHEGPFLMEERDLLDSIAARIGKTIELMRSRREMERLNLELMRKNRHLEQIMFAASHDVRAPLVNVQGFGHELTAAIRELTAILDPIPVPEPQRERYLRLIREEIPETMGFIMDGIMRIESLNRGMLLVSRIGQQELDMRPIDMNRLMGEILATFEFRIRGRGIRVTVGDLPPCLGDRRQIGRVFSNLIDNAITYTCTDPAKDGRIVITGGVEDGGHRSRYRVEDNGMGIHADHHRRIFDMFYRLNPADTHGEGLGLTIVSRILERHNGEITVESEVGKGSRFIVHLPGPDQVG